MTARLSAGAQNAREPIVVTINGDTTNEFDETFLVNLSSPVNATLNDSQGVGTIVNDDAPLLLIDETTGRVLALDSMIPVRHYHGSDFCVVEHLWSGRLQGFLLGTEPSTFRILHVFEFTDGKISRESVWTDDASIARRLTD